MPHKLKIWKFSETKAGKKIKDFFKDAGDIIWYGETEKQKIKREKESKEFWDSVINWGFYGVAGAFLIGTAIVIYRRK